MKDKEKRTAFKGPGEKGFSKFIRKPREERSFKDDEAQSSGKFEPARREYRGTKDRSYGRDRDSRPSYSRDRDTRPAYRDRDARPSFSRDREARPFVKKDFTEKKSIVPAIKLIEGIREGQETIHEFIQEITKNLKANSQIKTIEIDLGFDATGKFIGVGRAADASIKITINM